jgi:hypothetical protein
MGLVGTHFDEDFYIPNKRFTMSKPKIDISCNRRDKICRGCDKVTDKLMIVKINELIIPLCPECRTILKELI